MVHQVMIATVGEKYSPPSHTNTLAAGLDVKPAKLKPTAGFRLMHLLTTLPHTDQTLYTCVFVCVDPSPHHKHTHGSPRFSLVQPVPSFKGLWQTLQRAVGLLDARSISFSLCPGCPPPPPTPSPCLLFFSFPTSATQTWPRPRPTALKRTIVAVPCHAPSPTAGP